MRIPRPIPQPCRIRAERNLSPLTNREYFYVCQMPHNRDARAHEATAARGVGAFEWFAQAATNKTLQEALASKNF